jgi:glycogen debranching enzyme
VHDQQISILEGTTFVVSDAQGDIAPSRDRPLGLFHRDMRHLSRWQVRLNGRELAPLSAVATAHSEALFFLVEPTGTVYRDPDVSVTRKRRFDGGMREELGLTNHRTEPLSVELSMLFDADFADLFEVKDQLRKQGRLDVRTGDGEATLCYERGDFRRETVVRAPGAFFTAESFTFRVRLDPLEEWHGEIEVGVTTARSAPAPSPARTPRLETEWDDLNRTYLRSLDDLAALRFHPDAVPGAALPAAGLPWFMALFGRDSLITSYQALPFMPDLCRTTLRALAAHQAGEVDDFRDAEPGKILHELRLGELAHFGERPHSPYYGSADATPLFLIVLDEYERWTGDAETVRDLEGAARAALGWLDRFGDGFVTYESRNPSTGLTIQCWKDSWDSIVHPDGRLAPLPHATCEIQGYAYDARRRAARLARDCWNDPDLADRLEDQARALRDRFVERFWLPGEAFYALALDGDGEPVPTLTSNIGHLLWSGIVPDEHVAPVVAHLLGADLFSGWGVRTLAAGQRPFNPMGYHRGTIWPHDNSLIVAGLTRYGRRAEAATLARAILESARHFDYRLPEAFVGADREAFDVPVAYPAACSPQAWAAATPLLLLRCLLGLSPAAGGLTADPHVPAGLGRLGLRGVPGRWGHADVRT